MFETTIAAVVLAPALLLYAAPALWRYRQNATWFEGRESSPTRLVLSTILYAVPALIIVVERLFAIWNLRPAYEYLDMLFMVPLIVWLLMLRAAMAAPRSDLTA